MVIRLTNLFFVSHLQAMNGNGEDTYRTSIREKTHLSPTGHRPSLEQFGSMKIEFLQDNRANPKEWSVSIDFHQK